MKRILTILLSLSILLTCVTGFAEDIKEPIDNINLITNGDFEKYDSNGIQPEGWTVYQKEWKGNKYVSLDKANAFSGKTALKISTTEGGMPWASQYIHGGITEDAEYQIRAMVKISGTTAGTFAFKFEYYRGDNYDGSIGTGAVTDREGNTDGKWKQYANTVRIPAGTTTIALYPRMYGNGTAYIDDIQLFKVSEPPRIRLSVDDVIFYTDYTGNGRAEVELNKKAYPDFSDNSIRFRFLDGENTILEKTVKDLSHDTVEFVYDAALIGKKEYAYTIEAAVLDKAGKVIGTADRRVYKFDRPQALDENGFFHRQDTGEIVNPVIAYHVTKEMYPSCKEVGVTVVQAPMHYLDDLQKAGLMGLGVLYGNMKPAAHPDNVKGLADTIRKYKDHPALFAYAVMDEPYGNYSEPDKWLEDSYTIIRTIDPYHPVYICEDPHKEHIDESAKYCDVLCSDPYPRELYNPAAYIGEIMKIANQAVDYKKPTYALLQAFEWGGYFPKGNELRNGLYQAFMEDVKGVGFYCFESSYKPPEADAKLNIQDTELWSPMKEFYEAEMDNAFRHFVQREFPPFNHYRGNDIWYRGFVKNGEIYLIVLNRDNTAKKVDIKLESYNKKISVNGYTASVLRGSEFKDSFSGSGGILTAEITGNDALVFKITPSSTLNFGEISWAEFEKTVDYLKDDTGYVAADFKDLKKYPWAEEAINNLNRLGIVNSMGENLYVPAKNITRADFAMFLVRTLKLSYNGSDNFADVDPEAYYAAELAAGKAAGIINGIGDNKFNPEAEISRQDLMTIIARALGLKGENESLSGFTDADKIAGYALESVRATVAAGIIAGNADGTLNPLGNATRAEAAVIMDRILKMQK